MNNFTRMVQQFHQKFGLGDHQLPKPGFPVQELALYRANFMLEELCEYAAACGYGLVVKDGEAKFEKMPNMPMDLHDALDGLVDLEYVLHGTVLFHGMGGYAFDSNTSTRLSIFEAAFIRVHQANMAKVRAPSSEASKRNSTYDVIKPEGWKSAVFHDLLDVAK